MKVGLHIPDFTWDGGPAALRVRLGEVAQHAEQAGVDRISVMDHVWQIGHLGPPEHEMLEAYTTLGWLAAKTDRVKLLTVVTAVVYREPGLLAKAVTTLDVLSGGRVMLGIGSGWMKEEFESLGIDFRQRGARTDEAIQAMRALWSEGPSSFEGKHFSFGPLHSYPKPVRKAVPIHVGGNSPAAARRAGRFGDGYFPTVVNPEKLKQAFALVRSEAQAAGRDPAAIEFSCMVRSTRPDDLKPLADLGVSRVVMMPPGTNPEVITRSLEKFQQDVIARM